MLKWNINERFSAEQCLNHPFLASKKKFEDDSSCDTIYFGKENRMQ